MSDVDHYDYVLPRELIAQEPLPNRADAKLLVVDRQAQALAERRIRDLPELLRPGDCLVVNDSRVLPARLLGQRIPSGGRWEGLFLAAERGLWRLIGKTRGRLAPGDQVQLTDAAGRPDLVLTFVERFAGGGWIVAPDRDEPVLAALERCGRIPLPKYIRAGQALPTDRERYQTVYAREPGSVAAPTAGLHFTEKLLELLRQQGIETARVTLHVGLGTFRPIEAPTLAEHQMHSEWGRIDAATVEQLARCRAAGGRIVAIGTTSVRVLESASVGGQLVPWQGETNLFIRPPYEFRSVDALLTNFHLPRSTLLVLVRAFGGDDLIRRAYDQAIRSEFRFYSYGDAMLIV
ncbi:MAG: tRNA preQ1(34) S-adenosylmethionine ribosyltransferase-isomerase QueA [Planctomycetaceae bacterium]|nr:tRNA preQ1(34) S-adenosylmethionine ribosyltransferase-isomerase QueA [Planctomycetaceae bacterium]